MYNFRKFKRFVLFEGMACKLTLRNSGTQRRLSIYCLYDAGRESISLVTFIVHSDRNE